MTRAVCIAAGLGMVAAAQVGSHTGHWMLGGFGAVLAVLGGFAPRFAVAAVLVTAALVALGPGTLATAAVSGVGATTYLAAAHTLGQPGVRAFAWPTLCVIAGFTVAAVVGAVAAPGVAWVPLAAPVLVVLGYAGVLVSADARATPLAESPQADPSSPGR